MVKNEMIERVANAIMKVETDDKISDYYKFARAAIEALLEPTDEMVEAAVSEFTSQHFARLPNATPQSIQKAVLRRAIKAALDPEDA